MVFSYLRKKRKIQSLSNRILGAAREGEEMEVQQQSWRLRFSFRNATMAVCFMNVVAVLFLLQGFLSAASSRHRFPPSRSISDQVRYVQASEETRLALQPLRLIQRVREIKQEAYAEPESIQQDKDTKKQTSTAIDLSKRLKDFHSLNDATSLKALEEWRKRKMERARQRELEKNGTTAFPQL